MSCADFFRENAENREPCKALQKMPQADVLAFESQSASSYSPGVVANGEYFWRQVINPTHFDRTKNELKVTAFQDVSDKGGSVYRGFANFDELSRLAQERVDGLNARNPAANLELVGLVRLECAAVREVMALNSSGVNERGFIVVDTATENEPSHADICQIVGQPAQGRSVRVRLVEMANEFLRTRDAKVGASE